MKRGIVALKSLLDLNADCLGIKGLVDGVEKQKLSNETKRYYVINFFLRSVDGSMRIVIENLKRMSLLKRQGVQKIWIVTK